MPEPTSPNLDGLFLEIKTEKPPKPLPPATREAKIKGLEALLYQKTAEGRDTKDILAAIELLQSNRIEDEQIILRYGKSAAAVLFDQLLTATMIGCIVFLLSLLGGMLCDGKQTRFCHDTRVIPLVLYNYFTRETPLPPRKPQILPLQP